MASQNPKNSGTIRIWSNDARDLLIDLWSEETVQFALENSKTSKETREVCSTMQASNTFYLIRFDHNMMHLLKDCEVTGLLIDARDKFESQIFLVLFFQCILAYIYKLGTFVYKLLYFTFELIDKLSFYSAFHKTFEIVCEVRLKFPKFTTNYKSCKSPKRHIKVCVMNCG